VVESFREGLNPEIWKTESSLDDSNVHYQLANLKIEDEECDDISKSKYPQTLEDLLRFLQNYAKKYNKPMLLLSRNEQAKNKTGQRIKNFERAVYFIREKPTAENKSHKITGNRRTSRKLLRQTKRTGPIPQQTSEAPYRAQHSSNYIKNNKVQFEKGNKFAKVPSSSNYNNNNRGRNNGQYHNSGKKNEYQKGGFKQFNTRPERQRGNVSDLGESKRNAKGSKKRGNNSNKKSDC
jgi:hypothetical protein